MKNNEFISVISINTEPLLLKMTTIGSEAIRYYYDEIIEVKKFLNKIFNKNEYKIIEARKTKNGYYI